ncbi:MAG: glycosyltransferase [Cyanobacteria bacterium HKST-UBA02]|nr:glycosyltransferase [Cyanobacteria bacterium HKST-UBA02]
MNGRNPEDLVSICLPVWNGKKYLETAIRSALEQTHRNLELVIVDDCSTDGSIEIIESLAREDDRIRFFRNDSRLGLFKNYNRCMLKADGEYIKPFAQDDVFYPDALEKLLRLVEDRPEIVLASCNRNSINDHGYEIPSDLMHASVHFESGKAVNRHDVLMKSVRPLSNIIGEPSCVMYRRKCMAGGFDAGFTHIGDLEYWFRILLHGSFVCTSEVLCSVRHHGGRQTVRNYDNLSVVVDQLALARLWSPELEKHGFTPGELVKQALIESAQHIERMVSQGNLNKPSSGGGSNEQQLLWLAFEALCALGQDRSPYHYASSRVNKNERRIRRLESYVRSLLADPGWRLTRPLREANRLLRSDSDQLSPEAISESKDRIESSKEVLRRQSDYLLKLKRTAIQVKNSKSWKIRENIRTLLQSKDNRLTERDKNRSRYSQLSNLLADLAYVQKKYGSQTRVDFAPVDDLISERFFDWISNETTPKISVLICACHDSVAETLLALNHQSLKPEAFEVILIDGFNSREFESDVESVVTRDDFNLQLRAFRSKNVGRSAGHNLAIRLARSELLIFLAGDFIPGRSYVEAHLNFHQNQPDRRVVGIGRGLFPDDLRNTEFRRWLEDSGSLFGISFNSESGQVPSDFFYAGNSSAKTEFISAVGLFDEDFPDDAWDDFEIGIRMNQCGMQALLVEGADCPHQHPLTFKERCSMTKLEAGENALILDCKHAGKKDWHSMFRYTPAQHRENALSHLKRYRTLRNKMDKVAYWENMLAAKFVEGYLDHLQTLISSGKLALGLDDRRQDSAIS